MALVSLVGAFCFGIVVGWVTYRSLRHSKSSGIKDIAAVIGAVGGATVTALFRQETGAFGMYCLGLALGFFGYVASAIIIARRIGKLDPKNPEAKTLAGVAEWLGDPPQIVGSSRATITQTENDDSNLGLPQIEGD
jgi:hypothetical protein